jgi:DNA-binding beta-propeller fold protein YncE
MEEHGSSPAGRRAHRRVALPVLVAALLAMLWLAAGASGADRLYWINSTEGTISFANLDGSGGGMLDTAAAPVDEPGGLAIDPAANRLYWVNHGSDTIGFASLDGGGGGTLAAPGAAIDEPSALTIDPVAGRLYWPNLRAGTIGFARLDGSGGGTLDTAGAPADEPGGIVAYPAAHRIFWTNHGSNTISATALGGGGGELVLAGPELNGPSGIAVDPATSRLYWTNLSSDTIGFANLDGSDAITLGTAGAPVQTPAAIAIDPAVGRLYWSNVIADTISVFGPGGGATFDTGGVAVKFPTYLALLESPSSTAAPVITGKATVGSTLTCGTGSWAADQPEAFLFRAPSRFAYSWERDGAALAGTDATLTARDPGEYRCTVTAANAAGSVGRSSAAVRVTAEPAPPSPPASTPGSPPPSTPRSPGRARAERLTPVRGHWAQLRLRCKGSRPCGGSLELRASRKGSTTRLGARTFRLGLGKRRIVGVRLTPAAHRLLRKAAVPGLTATLTGSGVVKRTVQLLPPSPWRPGHPPRSPR